MVNRRAPTEELEEKEKPAECLVYPAVSKQFLDFPHDSRHPPSKSQNTPFLRVFVGYFSTATRKVTNTMYDNIGNGLHRGYKMKILELIFTKGKTFFLKVKSPLQAVAKELFLCGPISKI